jgi:hypothetical protein
MTLGNMGEPGVHHARGEARASRLAMSYLELICIFVLSVAALVLFSRIDERW